MTFFFETAQSQINEVDELRTLFLSENSPKQSLSIEELEKKLACGEMILIDVRPSIEYFHAHIPGAISIPLSELEKKINEFPENKQIVAYCRGVHCHMSANAITLIEQHGIEAIRLPYGVSDWKFQRK